VSDHADQRGVREEDAESESQVSDDTDEDEIVDDDEDDDEDDDGMSSGSGSGNTSTTVAALRRLVKAERKQLARIREQRRRLSEERQREKQAKQSHERPQLQAQQAQQAQQAEEKQHKESKESKKALTGSKSAEVPMLRVDRLTASQEDGAAQSSEQKTASKQRIGRDERSPKPHRSKVRRALALRRKSHRSSGGATITPSGGRSAEEEKPAARKRRGGSSIVRRSESPASEERGSASVFAPVSGSKSVTRLSDGELSSPSPKVASKQYAASVSVSSSSAYDGDGLATSVSLPALSGTVGAVVRESSPSFLPRSISSEAFESSPSTARRAGSSVSSSSFSGKTKKRDQLLQLLAEMRTQERSLKLRVEELERKSSILSSHTARMEHYLEQLRAEEASMLQVQPVDMHSGKLAAAVAATGGGSVLVDPAAAADSDQQQHRRSSWLRRGSVSGGDRQAKQQAAAAAAAVAASAISVEIGPRIAKSHGSGCTVHEAHMGGWTCVVKQLRLETASLAQVEGMRTEVTVLQSMPPHRNIVRLLLYRHTAEYMQLFVTRYDGTLRDYLDKRRRLARLAPVPLYSSGGSDTGGGASNGESSPGSGASTPTHNLSGSEDGAPLPEPQGLLSPAEVCRLGTQVATGLLHMHQHHFMHRDIKSHNVFVRLGLHGEISYLALGDFDTSRRVSATAAATTPRGTPGWIAPEVANSRHLKASYDFKGDVYSFGMLLFELLTLAEPFESVPMFDVYQKVADGKLPSVPETVRKAFLRDPTYYSRLLSLFESCVEVDPAKRPDMATVKDTLLSVMQAIDLKMPIDLTLPGPRSLSDDGGSIPSTGSEDVGTNEATVPCEDQRPGIEAELHQVHHSEQSGAVGQLLPSAVRVRTRTRTTSQMGQVDDDEPSHASPRFASASASDSPRNVEPNHVTTVRTAIASDPSSPRLVIDI